jgi:hypothetical protein
MRFAPCMESTCDVHRRVTLPIPKSRFHWASPFSEDLGGVPTPETGDAQRNSAVGPRLGPRALLPKRARLRGENQRTSRLQIARSGDRPPNLWHAPRRIWRIRCRRQTCVRARKQQLVAAPLLSRAHGMCSGNVCHRAGLLHGDTAGLLHEVLRADRSISRSGRSPHARAHTPLFQGGRPRHLGGRAAATATRTFATGSERAPHGPGPPCALPHRCWAKAAPVVPRNTTSPVRAARGPIAGRFVRPRDKCARGPPGHGRKSTVDSWCQQHRTDNLHLMFWRIR